MNNSRHIFKNVFGFSALALVLILSSYTSEEDIENTNIYPADQYIIDMQK